MKFIGQRICTFTYHCIEGNIKKYIERDILSMNIIVALFIMTKEGSFTGFVLFKVNVFYVTIAFKHSTHKLLQFYFIHI